MQKEIDDLFAQTDQLAEQIATLANTQAKKFQEIATLSCPYREGDTLYTNDGLGKHGLRVTEVTFPPNPERNNSWRLVTCAISLAGEVTKRTVFVDEGKAKEMNLRSIK